jgi:hypothetical protein
MGELELGQLCYSLVLKLVHSTGEIASISQLFQTANRRFMGMRVLGYTGESLNDLERSVNDTKLIASKRTS